MPEDRRLAAIMFTDIVGYTALMGSDEDKAFKVLRKNREVQRPLIKKYRGEWLKEMGDGILASFHTASDAVRCAGAIQQVAKKEGISLRIGIHEGEVVFEGGDVLGDGVNVASRLEELAESGTINISGAVYKDIKNKPGISAEFIEEKILKNVEEPVKVYTVHIVEQIDPLSRSENTLRTKKAWPYYIIGILGITIILVFLWLIFQKGQSDRYNDPAEKSIAVLPFINDSPDEENEYFCNGLLDDILNHLANIGDLQVLSRTDVEPYRGSAKSRKEIAAELGVKNLLEGSVRKQGNRFKITLQLINAETGFHLWSNSYEGEYTEKLFSVQSDIARQVASALKAVITPKEEEAIDKAPTKNIEAYDLVKRGWSSLNNYQNTQNEEDRRKSITLFKNALQFDSTYIPAYSILISYYMNSNEIDSMFFFIEKLKDINPDSGGGYYFNGVYLYILGEADAAIDELQKALEVTNNTHIWARVALGTVYCNYKKEIEKGILLINSSIQECPESTKNIMYSWLISTLLNFGEYGKAEEYLYKAMDIKAGCYEIFLENMILNNQGEFQKSVQFTDSVCSYRKCESYCNWSRFNYFFNVEAYAECEAYFENWNEGPIHPYLTNWTKTNWAYALHMLNRNDEADQLFDELIVYCEQSLEKKYYWSLFDLSRIYAFRNERSLSLNYLREYSDYGLTLGLNDYIYLDPLFENLREDPEFLKIVNRVLQEKAEVREKIQELIEEEVI